MSGEYAIGCLKALSGCCNAALQVEGSPVHEGVTGAVRWVMGRQGRGWAGR